MDKTATATTPVVEKTRRAPKPRQHRLVTDPPPPYRLLSVPQIEAEHPGIKGRLRQWIHRADANDPAFRWLQLCVVRLNESVFINAIKFADELHQHSAMPPRPSRRGDLKASVKAGVKAAVKG